MIDLHCHILPGIDDGAKKLAVSLEMGRIAQQDGIEAIACTPHITPGVFNNDAWIIHDAVEKLQEAFLAEGIDIQLFSGADIHVSPDMATNVPNGSWPSLAGTRYFLFEPPHHVLPPNIVKLAKSMLNAGWIPLLTHPERLTWIEAHYDVIKTLDEAGVLVQITAGAITGRFGERPQYWSERLLEEGRVDVIATDAHSIRGRPPLLREGFEAAARITGEQAAWAMVHDTPLLILNNQAVPQKRRNNVSAKSRPARKGRHGLFGWLQRGKG